MKSITEYGKTMEAVDLGLSVRWGSHNVGARKPEESGLYYAWGETEPKGDYTWETYKYGRKLTKYNDGDDRRQLEEDDDVASEELGGGWRMPTASEMEELCHKCEWTWNGNGYVVKGPNGNSIFLPAAGMKQGSSVGNSGSCGYYWSASLSSDGQSPAYNLDFTSKDKEVGDSRRYRGFSIRAVKGKE